MEPTAPNPPKKLTPKQALFVAEYPKDFNATQAAIRAGYSAKTAASQGERLLRNVEISTSLADATEKRLQRVELDADWVLSRLKENVERAMQAIPVRDSEGEATGEYTYQGMVANKALELLGKRLGLFTDKVEHSGPKGGPLSVAVTRVVHHVAGK